MLLDSTLMFDPAGSAVTATRASTNVIDITTPRDLGVGEPLALTILPAAPFAAAGAATLQVQVQGSPDNATWTTYAESAPYSIANLNSVGAAAKGYLLPIHLPAVPAGAAFPRYLRLNYIVATGPFTSGTVQAYLNLGRDHPIAYPSAIPPMAAL